VVDNLSAMVPFPTSLTTGPPPLPASGSTASKDAPWSAREELALLDAIDMYGYGNWRDIAAFVGNGRGDSACMRHYCWVFLDKRGPMGTSSSNGWKPVAKKMNYGTSSSSTSSSSSASASAGAGAGAAGFSSDSASGASSNSLAYSTAGLAAPTPSASSAPATSGRNLQGGPGTPGYSHSHIPKTEVAGFMPLRGDFDIEHDNEAEAVIADLDFQEGEHVSETELKLKILEIYNAKLDERERRKAFVLERGLLDFKRLIAIERRRPREERELYDSLRPFARFMSGAEYEELLRGIIFENRLRKRIAALQEYRRVGLTSLVEAQDYEHAKKKNNLPSFFKARAAQGIAIPPPSTYAEYQKKPGGGAGGKNAMLEDDGGDDGPAAAWAAQLQASGLSLSALPSTLVSSVDMGEITGVKTLASESSSSNSSMTMDSNSSSSSSSASGAVVGVKRARPGKDSSSPPSSSPSSSSKSASAASGSLPFSLEGVPGIQSLTPLEVKLCEHLELLPYQYLQIKSTIIAIATAKGLAGGFQFGAGPGQNQLPPDVGAALVHIGE
jgi:Myb-like DNA-binding domain